MYRVEYLDKVIDFSSYVEMSAHIKTLRNVNVRIVSNGREQLAVISECGKVNVYQVR